MDALFWNCRGLGIPPIIAFLNDQMQQLRPLFVFLSKTKCSSVQVSRKARHIVRDLLYFDVPAQGFSGGLLLLWHPSVKLKILHSDVWIIHYAIEVFSFCYLSTFLYVSTKPGIRICQRDFIHTLKPNPYIPWIYGGNFNDIPKP